MSSAHPSPIVSIPRKRARPSKDTLLSSGMAKCRKTDDVYEFRDDDEGSPLEQSPPRQLLHESPLNQESSPSGIAQMLVPGSAAPRKQERTRENPTTPSNDPSHVDMMVRLPDDEEGDLATGITIQNPMQRSNSNSDGALGNPAVVTPQKRGRGRPRKNSVTPSNIELQEDTAVKDTKVGKSADRVTSREPLHTSFVAGDGEAPNIITPAKRGRGRPQKDSIAPKATVLQGDIGRSLSVGEEDILADGSTTHERTQELAQGKPDWITPVKRGRGRPRKDAALLQAMTPVGDTGRSHSKVEEEVRVEESSTHERGQGLAQGKSDTITPMKRGRGRPRRQPVTPGSTESAVPASEMMIPRKRGRPRKSSVLRDQELGQSGINLGTPANAEEGAQSDDSIPRGPAYSLSVDRAVEAQSSSAVTPRERGRPRKNTLTRNGTALQKSVDVGASNGMEEGSLSDGRRHSIQRSSVDAAEVQFPTTLTPRKRGRPRINPLSPNRTTAERRVSFGLPGGEDDELDLADVLTGDPVPALNGNLEVLKRIVLEKLTGKRRVQLIGMDVEYKKVYQLLEQTVVAGEGNSMLVVGARGSGKTTLVETIISEISAQHKEDFHTVRLNGFIHTDDKLALRQIWRQLGKEMEVDEDLTGKTNNYADTLSSLLALLSHPSELSENVNNEAAKSVIFILDEFDLFASHPRQTLLYNLFDIAQGRKAPVAVLGLTTKIDIVESLEKRVKSRFSHRRVLLSLPKNLRAFWEICKEALLVREDDIQSSGEREALEFDSNDGLSQVWNDVVEGLGNDSNFKHLLEAIFYKTKGVKDFYAECLMPIIGLSPQDIRLTGHRFLKSSLSAPESKLHILEGLSDLELSLLIAAARLDIILDTDTCNFNMAYDEYTTLASRVRLQSSASGAAAVGAGSKIWGREVAMSAWERLPEYGLIVPAIGAAGLGAAGGATGAGGGAGLRDVGRMGRMFRVDVGLEEIWQSVSSLGATMTKWCKEI